MIKLKKCEAFKRATRVFGDWQNWNRQQHIAYGLIRGVPYSVMEKYCNDNPDSWSTTRYLNKLGAFTKETSEMWWECLRERLAAKSDYEALNANLPEVRDLVFWVKKPVRVKIPRTPHAEQDSAAEE